MLNNLIPYMDAEDGTVITTTATNTAGTFTTAPTTTFTTTPAVISTAPETTPQVADEPKTGEDVKSEAQKIADAMVAKKLKGMPSKEEVAEFKQWKEHQKTETERIADRLSEADRKIADAEARETKANAIMSAAKLGISADHIEDAVILAMAKVSDDVTLDDAMRNIAQTNPSWTAAVKLPENGSNPVSDDEKTTEIKRFF